MRSDGSITNTPEQNADDVHRVIAETALGPVQLFGSSGGAVTGLALVAAHPGDVSTLVAHEPPLLAGLPDAERAFAAERGAQQVYAERGWGHGMAAFNALSSWRGEFTDEFLAQAPPDPAMFGMPGHDDGTRSDPLLSGCSNAITAFRPDVAALAAAGVRIVVGVGLESAGLLTDRTSRTTAEQLGAPVVEFPGGHAGFLGGEYGQAGDPAGFATTLRMVLDDA